MRPPQPRSGDPVRILPSPHRRLVAAVAVAVVLLLGSVTGWLIWPRTAPPPAVTAVSTPASVAKASAVHIASATEQQIREHVPTGLTVFRFADNPRILVLVFASLHEQGRTLNRLAAFIEKAGLPHDRLLTDAEIDAAIRARGDTVETFYYGHDYGTASLARFFNLADSEHVELNLQEERLRALLRQEDWFTSGIAGSVISLPSLGSDPKMTATEHAAILRHELSHGEFFSNPTYADYVRNFWLTTLTGDERAAFRSFLASAEYDGGNEDLMLNEMQAYLMFTHDVALFSIDRVGLTQARAAELRSRFLAGMPAGWLRNSLASYQAAAPAQ
jgi:hypothetical protein